MLFYWALYLQPLRSISIPILGNNVYTNAADVDFILSFSAASNLVLSQTSTTITISDPGM